MFRAAAVVCVSLVLLIALALLLAAPISAQIDPFTEEGTPPVPIFAPAQPPASIALVSTDRVEASLEAGRPFFSALSPDGTRLVYLADPDRLCAVTLLPIGGSVPLSCAESPIIPHTPHQLLIWSPDSRYVILYEDVASLFMDSDLVLYDVEAGIVQNLTNDGFEGGLINADPADYPPDFDGIPLDISPAWSPDSQTIYFVRTIFDGDPGGVVIYSLPVAGGDPTLVAEIGSGSDHVLAVFIGSMPYFDGGLSVSPSGRFLAASLIFQENQENRLILIDIATGAIETVASTADFNVGMVSDRPVAYFAGVDWLPDESGLIVAADNLRGNLGYTVAQVTFADGVVTPLVDLSALTEASAYAGGPEAPRLLIPIDAGLLPDGSAIVWAGIAEGQIDLWWAPLPLSSEPYTPDNRPPRIGMGYVNGNIRGWGFTVGAADGVGRALIAGTLFALLVRE